MPTANVNGIQLFYELNGKAEIPLVLVHGAWSSHHTWDRVAPRLAESFRVLTYDRRGHSQSERPAGQGSVNMEFDLDRIRDFSQPALLTMGDQSPPFYAPIVAKIADALPHAEVVTFPGAGHVPYNTHPDAYIEVITSFIHKHSE